MDRLIALMKLYQKGVIGHDILVNAVVDLASENDTDLLQLLSRLPPSIMRDVQAIAGDAPVSEEDWSRSQFIVGGAYTCSAYEASESAKLSFRKGVERLRQFLQSRQDS